MGYEKEREREYKKLDWNIKRMNEKKKFQQFRVKKIRIWLNRRHFFQTGLKNWFLLDFSNFYCENSPNLLVCDITPVLENMTTSGPPCNNNSYWSIRLLYTNWKTKKSRSRENIEIISTSFNYYKQIYSWEITPLINRYRDVA